ncbi:hypothetical protein DENIS_0542 [Desulfonema ishimotonii]|uniref:DUF4347 domain-containing protein n=1 Tax=Desulfonema ishimotonii TaxID=45657 RepID=A0A401FRL3_9BACT|nr:DUF4347 domain-containing protein [Desulfonema ishimotonii]GBC59603.1 hypothetical protein DENIS_0542 [Desulfonema ishimotonii]
MLNLIKLEDRIVLDGAAVGDALDHAADQDAHVSGEGAEVPDHSTDADAENVAAAAALLSDAEAPSESLDIVLVSNSLPDYQSLADAADPDALVIVYDADAASAEDVVRQITDAADAAGSPVGSVTVLSHGGSGYFNFGNEKITAESLGENTDAWAALGTVMAEDSHIYVYGCGVADDAGAGQALLNGLADATGADVFASDDVTGEGGDWDLEAASDGADGEANTPLDTDILNAYENALVGEETSVPSSIATLEDQPGSFGIFVYNGDLDGDENLETSLDDLDPDGPLTAQEINLFSGIDEGTGNVNVRGEWVTNRPIVINGETISQYYKWTVEYSPEKDQNVDTSGVATLTFDVDGENFSTEVTVIPVNDPPEFTKGPDQTIPEDSPAQVIEDWATDVLPGPETATDEASQNLEFTVTNDNANLFSVQPSISPDGTLTYTPAENAYGTATVTVVLKDDGGTAFGGIDTSSPQEFTITITPENDAPEVEVTVAEDYVENSEPVRVVTDIDITDADDTELTQVVVEITDGYQNDARGTDVLAFENTATIQGEVIDNGRAIVLTPVSGSTAAIADFEAAVKTVTIEHVGGVKDGDDPNQGDRTIRVSATDANSSGAGNGIQTGEGADDIFVDAIDDAPELDPESAQTLYIIDGGEVAFADDIVLTDVDDDNMTGAVIRITENYQPGEDVLNFTDTANITGTWTASTGTLTLTGLAAKAEYEAAIRSVTYDNTSGTPIQNSRTVNITVTDDNSRGFGDKDVPSDVDKPDGPLSADATRIIQVVPPIVIDESIVLHEDFHDPDSVTDENGDGIFDGEYEENAQEKLGVTVGDLVTINDADFPDGSAPESIAITDVDDASGTWQYSLDGGKNWTAIDDGNLSDTHALLLTSSARIRFAPDQDFNTERSGSETPTFTARAWDESEGTEGNYADTTSSDAFSRGDADGQAVVIAINDAPEIDGVPADDQKMDENGQLTIDGISVADIDVNEGTGDVRVSLAVENGTITLGRTDGLTFEAGKGNGTSNVVFTGSLTAVNQAISSLTYDADDDALDDFLNAGDFGQPFDTLDIDSSDQGNFGQPGPRGNLDDVSINIFVGNTPPVIDLDPDDDGGGDPPVGPADPDNDGTSNFNVTFIEDSKCVPVRIADSDDPAPLIVDKEGDDIAWVEVTLTNPQEGDGLGFDESTISGTNITYTVQEVDGALVLRFEGAADASQYDQVLRSVTYNNTSENPDTTRRIIEVTAADVNNPDRAGEVALSRVSVVPVNDAPTNTVPDSVTIEANTSVALDTISVTDPDVAGGAVQVTVTTDIGTLVAADNGAGADITPVSASQIIITGTLDQVNAALAGVVYTPPTDFNGNATVTVTTNDQGYTGINPDDITQNSNGRCITADGILDNSGNVIPPDNEGTPDDPTAQTDTDTILIRVIAPSDPDVTPVGPPDAPDNPILPIIVPEGEPQGPISPGPVTLPGPVGITGGEASIALDGLAASAKDIPPPQFCSIEEALRIHLGCRFANTNDPEAKFGTLEWSDMTDLGWRPPYEYLDEEYDLYSGLFLREAGDPGFNVEAGVLLSELGGLAERSEEVFSKGSGTEGFNEIAPGELKTAFFAGRKSLDKSGR